MLTIFVFPVALTRIILESTRTLQLCSSKIKIIIIQSKMFTELASSKLYRFILNLVFILLLHIRVFG